MPRVRMKISVLGTFYNNPEGVQVGDIVDLDGESAAALIAGDRAELADQRGEQHAIHHSRREERAVMPSPVVELPEPEPEPDPEPEPEPDPEPEPEPEPEPVKRRPGRPRKTV